MKDRRVKASEMERSILQRRAERLAEAKAAFEEADQVLAEQFTLFCAGKGIPMGAALIGVDGEEVVVKLPDVKLAEGATG